MSGREGKERKKVGAYASWLGSSPWANAEIVRGEVEMLRDQMRLGRER